MMNPGAVLRRHETSFAGARGQRLACRSWQVAEQVPLAAIAVCHGFGEHCGRYDHLGEWFAQRGYAVHAYDHIGHGRSVGARNFVEHFDDYLDDLGLFLERVRSAHPDVPLVLVGHSMGGLIGAKFLAERSPRLDRAVLSASALAARLPAWQMALARFIRLFAPRFRIASGLAADGLSRDPAVVSAYIDDPYVDTKISVSLVVEMMTASAATAPLGAQVEVPTLVLHGEDDPISPARGSERFAAAIRAPGSALRTYPGLRHEIFNEPEQEAIFAEIHEWLGEGSVAAAASGTAG